MLVTERQTISKGVGTNPAAIQAAMQTPSPVLQAMIAAGIPIPAVIVPNVNPAGNSKRI